MYHALYRKYRPISFDDVVGQNSIIKTLKNSIINKSFSHAYMFFGPRGTGKTTISKIFARSINCLDTIDGNACGKCKNCLHSFEKECVDIIEIDAASNNGVDEIRDLKNKISLVPGELNFKVYIIDEVHMLSMGAFNALLKTLEEPPEHAIFILATTDPQKVPETIISRCQCFSFKRISDSMIVSRLKKVCELENISIDEDVLLEIAIASEGGMRDSLGLLDKLRAYSDDKITMADFAEINGVLTKNDLHDFCNSIFNNKIGEALSNINKYNDDGKNIIQIMSQLMLFLKNMLVDYYIYNKKSEFSINNIKLLINSINEKMFDMKKCGNPLVYIEMMLISFIDKTNNNYENSDEFKSNLVLSDNKNIIDQNKDISDKLDSKNNNSSDNLKSEVSKIDKEVLNFDKESSLKQNVNNTNSSNNMEINAVYNADNNINTYESLENEDVLPTIKNLDDIMTVRINNTFAKANKKTLLELIAKKQLFNDYTFDQKIGYIVCNLIDGEFRVASDNSLVISYEHESIVKQNLIILDKITYVFNKIIGTNLNLVIISHDRWNIEKNKYIETIKNGNHYEVMDEPKEVFEETKNDAIISNSAIDLFGDIVEIQ